MRIPVHYVAMRGFSMSLMSPWPLRPWLLKRIWSDQSSQRSESSTQAGSLFWLTLEIPKRSVSYEVVNGRHPTVETGLLKANRVFTPNTLTFTPTSKLQIITGPNMAGKSTALRQAAIITILAQTGAFVPADSATIGLVDKVFSRVGAKDDLFRDRSTFMVEMLETAEILRRATPRSLVGVCSQYTILSLTSSRSSWTK
jgi:ATPase subunit of ABC transporter with duplicated ATPase domains